MSLLSGWMKRQGPRKSRPFAQVAKNNDAIDPQGQRLLGLTKETDQPIWAPPSHSLLLSANGGGKTTKGLMVWVLSLLASSDRPAIILLDSKDAELYHQLGPLLERFGIPTAVIDDTHLLSANAYGRAAINPLGSVAWSHEHRPQDMVFAADSVTQTFIPEPEQDEKNKYWRAWPRLLIEFSILVLLRRSPEHATPGAVWRLLSSPSKLQAMAQVEAQEGTGMVQVLAENILGMVGHEHFWQHVQAAQDATRSFAIGSPLHRSGIDAKVSHFDLIRERRVIFLCGSQADIQSQSVFYGLNLMSFMRACYKGAGRVWLGADEFTNAPVQKMVDATTTLRAYGMFISYIAQSRSEIKRKFGEAALQTIEENSVVKQFFGFSSFEEAERVSKIIGEEHAVATSVGGDNDLLKMQTNLSLIKQRFLSPSELMAMRPDEQLLHIKGLGFYVAKTISQQNIAPYCDLLADNPLEGGRLPSDPWIRLTLPEEVRE